MRRPTFFRFAALTLAAALLLGLLASCSGGLEATTMHLARIQGSVGVSDGEGRDLEPAENLGLYSGYKVGTRSESYAWVDLDEVKLTKMDQDSEIQIQKEDKHLTIEVKSGSLFFNVTEPLADDETMDIRSSTMVVGIRGTCGWVEVPDPDHMNLYLLEGTVECTAGEETATVNAGELAAMTADGGISVSEFTIDDVPAFVTAEVNDAGISDIDKTLETLAQRLEPDADLIAGLERIGYHGDPAACRMTPAQRTAYAQILRDEIAKTEKITPLQVYPPHVEPICFSTLLDVGGGNPVLILSCAAVEPGNYVEGIFYYGYALGWENVEPGQEPTRWGVWQYLDGQAVKLEDAGRIFYSDQMLAGGSSPDGVTFNGSIYPYENGQIASTPRASAQGDYEENTFSINGQPAAQEQFESWRAEQLNSHELWVSMASSGAGSAYRGMALAQDVLAVLEGSG